MNKANVLLTAFIIGATLIVAYGIGVNFLLGQVTITSTTINYSSSGTLNATQQRMNAESYGLNLTSGYFTCYESSGCEKVQIAPCDNNLPSQSACINPAYYPQYYSQWKNITNHTFACPDFIEAGSIICSCDLQTDSCVEQHSA